VSDSITSISCGFVVQQVVRLAVRLADCCIQLVVDFCCGLAVSFHFVVDLLYNMLLQQVVRQIHNKSKQWSPTLTTLYGARKLKGVKKSIAIESTRASKIAGGVSCIGI